MGAVQLGVLAGAALCQFDYTKKLDEYSTARGKYSDVEDFSTYSEYKHQRELMLSKHDDAVNSKKLRNVLLFSAVLGIRAVGALESAVFMPRAGEEERGIVSSMEDGANITLAWRYRF